MVNGLVVGRVRHMRSGGRVSMTNQGQQEGSLGWQWSVWLYHHECCGYELYCSLQDVAIVGNCFKEYTWSLLFLVYCMWSCSYLAVVLLKRVPPLPTKIIHMSVDSHPLRDHLFFFVTGEGKRMLLGEGNILHAKLRKKIQGFPMGIHGTVAPPAPAPTGCGRFPKLTSLLLVAWRACWEEGLVIPTWSHDTRLTVMSSHRQILKPFYRFIRELVKFLL